MGINVNTMMIKRMLYITVLTFVLMYLISILLRNAYRRMQVKLDGKECSLFFDMCDKETYETSDLQKIGLPADFFQRDFITDNYLVDKLAPLLQTNKEVIKELKRIQFKMLTSLIGRFKYAMLFNFAAFENKGDPAITVGELAMIRKLGLKLIFHCATPCKREAVEYAKTLSKQYRYEEIIILMQGGGNLLSYIFEDFNRKLVLETFPEFEVILFPQSIWNNATKEHARLFQNVYSKHKHLTFLYRDRNSFNLSKRIFPHVKCYLMPDMAFHIKATQRFMEPTHDILWIQRPDKESTKYKIPVNVHNYDVIVGDWWGWKTPKGSRQLEDPFLMTANGMTFLQRGRVVITDRLHGHILCVLCGIPHVVFDPMNNKITSCMKSWTAGIENILVAHSAEDALNKAIVLLTKLDDKIPKALAFTHSKSYP